MKTFDWIFTWIVPPLLSCWFILWRLKAKRKNQSISNIPDRSTPSLPTTVIDKPAVDPFNAKLESALDRAGKARKSILHSALPEKDRLQIADEILYLIDDIMELQIIKLEEESTLWK